MARSSACTDECAPKVLDTADIVRDAMLRQQQHSFRFANHHLYERWATNGFFTPFLLSP